MRVRSVSTVLALAMAALVLAGCPKRPVTPVAQVPAPPAPPAAAPAPPPAPAPAPPPAPPAAAAPAPAPTPSPAPARPSEYAHNAALKDIGFGFDRADIRPADARILDASAAWLASNPRQLVLIEGHCDERGTSDYNLALGERRARAAMNHLMAKGIEANRITIISYGEERPSCTQKTEACWSANRRAHFLVKER